MNKERMVKIIKDIDRFFKDLEELDIKNVRDLESKESFYAASMILFSIVNRAIDLGEEMVSAKKLGFPEKYREIFYLLKRSGIIDQRMYRKLSALIHFRNLAAHEYYTFTEADVFKALKNISVVKRFVEAVKKAVR
jgi:uncharacterized protein YutE (UPF0331/DUF86 family)